MAMTFPETLVSARDAAAYPSDAGKEIKVHKLFKQYSSLNNNPRLGSPFNRSWCPAMERWEATRSL
jgi:hypothetical protein